MSSGKGVCSGVRSYNAMTSKHASHSLKLGGHSDLPRWSIIFQTSTFSGNSYRVHALEGKVLVSDWCRKSRPQEGDRKKNWTFWRAEVGIWIIAKPFTAKRGSRNTNGERESSPIFMNDCQDGKTRAGRESKGLGFAFLSLSWRDFIMDLLKITTKEVFGVRYLIEREKISTVGFQVT